MKEVIPNAIEFIDLHPHLSTEELMKKYAKMHVQMALEEAFKISKLDIWHKDLIYSCYPQTKIK